MTECSGRKIAMKKLPEHYRLHGRFVAGRLHLSGTHEELEELVFEIEKALEGDADGNGNVVVEFDGVGAVPVKQGGA